jgi:hypothetical protein
MKLTWLSVMAAAAALGAAELPVRTVVLYKHGIGYFERSGELGAGESARLDFKAADMNDVLKSLTITELGGGKISGLRYDSSEPLDRKLSEYSFRIQDRLPLSAFLDQLKGARIELVTGTQTATGAILSGRQDAGAERQPPREMLVLLNDSGELQTIDLASVGKLKLQDPALQQQLKEYLQTLSLARSRDKKSVYIDSSDKPGRKLFASYVIPTPVWKSSYRLIFREASEPLLEGWAIVDNTTGEDWTKVNLALVSGRPVSFVSRLYEPRFVNRPVADLPGEAAQGPVINEGAIVGAPAPPPAPVQEAGTKRELRQRLNAPAAVAKTAAVEVFRDEVASSVEPAAATRELGDLFEYRFSTPVNIRKSESAMIPFLQQALSARKLLIYSGGSSVHPMTAAELTNSTGKTLDGGPITVFDSNAYAGEALFTTLKTGDKRLISYGVDLGTRLTSAFDSTSRTVRELHFRRGILTVRSAIQETTTFTIRNVDARSKTLIVEHPVRPGYKLVNLKPLETTSNAYRFEVKLAPSAADKLAIPEERLIEESLTVANLTPDVLVSYVQNKTLSPAVRQQLERLAELKRSLAAADNESKRLEVQIRETSNDQSRIRENIASLNRVSGQQEQVQKYARDLAAQESQLAALRDQLSEVRKRRTTIESDLNALVEKLEF